VVELMRQGRSPQQACKAVERIVKITQRRNKNLKDIQVGFIAINKKGEYGSYCIQDGFNFAVYDQKGNRLEKPEFALK
jgi:N4-(beta-N-acetylglucosaminyl)-L-asparaginase